MVSAEVRGLGLGAERGNVPPSAEGSQMPAGYTLV